MIPIQDLLHRIQWDPALAGARFEIGYLDRVADRIVRVPFGDVRLGRGPRLVLEAVGPDGSMHTVPLHRVREVWRDGQLIWQRLPPPPALE